VLYKIIVMATLREYCSSDSIVAVIIRTSFFHFFPLYSPDPKARVQPFMACHFLSTGLGPTNKFNTTIHIISPSCFVNIPVRFLKSIFRFIENMLSYSYSIKQKNINNMYFWNPNQFQCLVWCINQRLRPLHSH